MACIRFQPQPPYKRRLKALLIATLGLFFDVRVTTRGKVHLLMRDKRAEKKVLKRLRQERQREASA